MKRYEALEVHVDIGDESVIAGHAQFHRARGALTSTTFQYATDYLAHAKAYQLDPALGLYSGTQQVTGPRTLRPNREWPAHRLHERDDPVGASRRCGR